MGEIALRGSVQGVETRQAAQLEFPKTDAANPEINRLWAWHRINSLLKDADRKGDRSVAIPEIVRLGEDFSIATEYTSFLVLENDAEYQRWKIMRRNLESGGRDRQAQFKRREQLDAIRNKALAELGPQAVAAPQSTPVRMVSAQSPANRPTRPPSRSLSKSRIADKARTGFHMAAAQLARSACWPRFGLHGESKSALNM